MDSRDLPVGRPAGRSDGAATGVATTSTSLTPGGRDGIVDIRSGASLAQAPSGSAASRGERSSQPGPFQPSTRAPTVLRSYAAFGVESDSMPALLRCRHSLAKVPRGPDQSRNRLDVWPASERWQRPR